ncbi:hypothetical protein OROMI_023440 [Orobanche minor]
METISSYIERENMERKTTLLMSSDCHIFQVEEAVVAEFQAIHRFLPAGGAAIPISQITGQILAKVIEYCRKHNDHKLNRLLDQEISAWDRDFVVVNEKILVDLLTALGFEMSEEVSDQGMLIQSSTGLAIVLTNQLLLTTFLSSYQISRVINDQFFSKSC